MKLTKDTVAKLMLPADKRDVIFFDDEMRGLGYRLRRSPNGQVRASWILQFRAAGRARRYLIGAGDVSAQAARAKAQKLKGQIWQGEDPQADRRDQRDRDKVTFANTAMQFLAAKEGDGLRPRTLFQLQRYLLDGPYLRAFHALPLDRVSKRGPCSTIRVATRAASPGSTIAAATSVRFAMPSPCGPTTFGPWSRAASEKFWTCHQLPLPRAAERSKH
jgi:hypothetical protein